MAYIPIRWGLGKLAGRATAAAAAAAAAASAAREKVEDNPDVRTREVDCADTPDVTACNECLLGNGRVGQPPTPRYITHKTRINYDYQLQVANMHAGPERFGYVIRGDGADEVVNIDLEAMKGIFGRGGEFTTLEWLFAGISFDGFWRSRCTVIETKGNFGSFFNDDGSFSKPFARSVTEDWLSSYGKQAMAVRGTEPQGKLEWHFMDTTVFAAAIRAGIPPFAARVTPFILGRIA
ncbi:Tox-REase-5 domain-containing protein [uncultured Stenotrophomonas sp.]|uniref:Tox-REase-5 domain-containing protein n=1 Tax=uncultured Stenotrophomonas sp. TaxID=165438 RepID=UPI0025DD4428|nr:Tox-REase-5 domain-containing protein [uncultured Stenotrophomonas sp.]